MRKVYTEEGLEKAIILADGIARKGCAAAAEKYYDSKPELAKAITEACTNSMAIYQDTLREVLGLKSFRKTTNKEKEAHEKNHK